MSPALLHQALVLQHSGRVVEAEALCRRLVAQHSTHTDAWHLLGQIRLSQGDAQEGLACLQQALAANPTQAAVHLSLGNALMQLKRPAQAIPHYRYVTQQAPHDAAAHNNLGAALREAGLLTEALDACDRALALKPDYARAHNNRGNTLRDLRRWNEALQAYNRAVTLDARYVIALNNRAALLQDMGQDTSDRDAPAAPTDGSALGDQLMAQGQPREAMACYEQQLRLHPDDLRALNNRGVAQLQLRLLSEARHSFEQVLQRSPGDAGALNNLGNALRELGLMHDALDAYRRATQARPSDTISWSNRANLLFDLKRPAEAVPCLDHLLNLDPEYDYALGNRWHGRRLCADWHADPQDTDDVLRAVHEGRRAIPPFALLSACDDPALHAACAQRYAADRFPAQTPLWPAGRVAPNPKKLRVAYLSADFHEHATAYLTVGVFEQHLRDRFEVIALSYGADDDGPMRRRLLTAFDHFEPARGLTDLAAAQRLHQLGVHIAVDLKGYTGQSRPGILAHRPAPLQVSWLGYPGTLGATYIDYVLADRHVLPPDQHRHYTEQVITLPQGYQPNDDQRPVAPVPSRAALGLPEDAFVFCCFNNLYKLTPACFSLWMRLLQQVPRSVLWLLGDSPQAIDALKREAQARGVEASRLVFAPRAPQAEHLARLSWADLVLDTLPYNAHTTASDALWMGVPVLTCTGQAFAGRVATSLLHAAGLAELITPDLDAYEVLACRLANDPIELGRLRQRAGAARASALFDTAGFTRSLEAAYEAMWQRHLAGQRPAAFT